jgi:hypothetical protein
MMDVVYARIRLFLLRKIIKPTIAATKSATPPMPTPIVLCIDAETPFSIRAVDVCELGKAVRQADEALAVI